MLEEVHLQNLVIFDHCSLPFAPGLNVISGETGAGKSLLASSIALALGARANSELIRSGCESAMAKAVFSRPGSSRVTGLLRDNGFSDDEETLIFERILRAGQSSRLSLNAAPVSVSLVRQITDYLFDMAAQNEHTRLTDAAYQRELLDSFGHLNSEPYREKYLAAMAILQRLEAGDAQKEKVKIELERIRYKLQKIEDFAFDPDNDLTLENQISALAHEEQIRNAAAAGAEVIYEKEESLTEQLGAVIKQCAPLGEFSPAIAGAVELLNSALSNLDEAARQLQDAQAGDVSADDIDALVKRSEDLKALLRLLECHDGAAAIPEITAALRAREEELANWEVDDAALHGELQKLAGKVIARGQELHAARIAAAEKLSAQVNKELRDLEMPQANFSVRFTALWEDTPPAAAAPSLVKKSKNKSKPSTADIAAPTMNIPADPAAVLRRINAGGLYEINFLIAPNPGEAASTLAETASGGEASRTMLAIKSALADAHNAQTLFFDEIDSGVGGRLGDVLGKKLRELARSRQVIVITHLPQIAAYADRHLKVAKSSAGGRTAARIEELTGDARVAEIAQMINGSAATAVTRAQAEEMLARRDDA